MDRSITLENLHGHTIGIEIEYARRGIQGQIINKMVGRKKEGNTHQTYSYIIAEAHSKPERNK